VIPKKRIKGNFCYPWPCLASLLSQGNTLEMPLAWLGDIERPCKFLFRERSEESFEMVGRTLMVGKIFPGQLFRSKLICIFGILCCEGAYAS